MTTKYGESQSDLKIKRVIERLHASRGTPEEPRMEESKTAEKISPRSFIHRRMNELDKLRSDD